MKILQLTEYLMDSQDPYYYQRVTDMYNNKLYEIRLKNKVWQIRCMEDGIWFMFLSTEIVSVLNDRFIYVHLVEDEMRIVAATEMLYYAQRINIMRKIMGDKYFKLVIKQLEEFGDAIAEAMDIEKPKEKVKPKFTIIDTEPEV